MGVRFIFASWAPGGDQRRQGRASEVAKCRADFPGLLLLVFCFWGMQDKRKEVRGGAVDWLVQSGVWECPLRAGLGLGAGETGISEASRNSLFIMPGRHSFPGPTLFFSFSLKCIK